MKRAMFCLLPDSAKYHKCPSLSIVVMQTHAPLYGTSAIAEKTMLRCSVHYTLSTQ
jgi:hypothetical protein